MRRLLVSVLVTVAIVVLASTTAVEAHFWPQDSQVAILTPKQIGKFLSTHRPVCLMLYAEYCGHCKTMVPEWVKFAKAMKDVVRVGAIDANTHQEVARQYQVQGFPTVKCWGMGNKKGKTASDYAGPRTAAAFQNNALGLIKGNTVSAQTREQFDAALNAASLKKSFVLFTNKDKVAPLYNVLSASPNYEGKIAFVVVKTASQKGKALVAELLGANAKLPQMRLYTAPSGEEGGEVSSDEYTGDVDYKTIAKYLLVEAGGAADPSAAEPSASSSTSSSSSSGDNKENNNKNKAAGDSADADGADEKKKKEEKAERVPPKRALPVTVTRLSAAAINDFCSGNAQGRKQPFCVVMFSSTDAIGGADPDAVRGYFSTEPILFFTVDDAAVFETLTGHFKNAGTPQTTAAFRALVFRTTKPGQTKFAWVNGAETQEMKDQIGHIFEGITKMSLASGLPQL